MSTGYVSNFPSTGYASDVQLREEFNKLKVALEDTISRSGQGEGSNAMGADLDMSLENLLNVDNGYFNNIYVEGIDLKSWIAAVSFQFFEVVPVTESTLHIGDISDHYKYFTVDKDSGETVLVLKAVQPGVTMTIRNNGYGAVTIQGEPGVIINSPSTANVRTAGGTVVVIAMPNGTWDLLGDVVPQYPGDGG